MSEGDGNLARDEIAVRVPACISAQVQVDGSPVRQVVVREHVAMLLQRAGGIPFMKLETGMLVPVAIGPRTHGMTMLTLLASSQPEQWTSESNVNGALTWGNPPDPTSPAEVLASLADRFDYRVEDQLSGRDGLRLPQIGALHAVLAHWTARSGEPATVVMPTGTGKTETMLAVFCAARPSRLLVVVPSDVLRQQTVAKFESLGVLQEFGVVSPAALRPVVGELRHRFADPASAREFADRCNVVVATPNVLTDISEDVRNALLAAFSHLFVDEAHHVPANTWRNVRDQFRGKPAVQFTATPFREDGQVLGGKLIYAYPLGLAQADGYFSAINYVSVLDFGAHDRAIARRAVEQLRTDLAAGYDHLVMARVDSIARCAEVLPLYEALAPDFAPVILHSAYPRARREAALSAVRNRTSRIIVCVNMLGEGFDLPALKVAAIHDAHKSLGVTLQFIGRFARTGRERLGDATAVVGRPSGLIDPRLRRLYSEDADWNKVIRYLSEGAVTEAEEVSEFESSFTSVPPDVPLKTLLPKMSTVVYRTPAEPWDPFAAEQVFPRESLLTDPIGYNPRARVAWFVVGNHTPIAWGHLETVDDVTYDLYLMYWDADRQLLYINSSNNGSHHQELAQAVCGDEAKRITGEAVYRVMAGINRLVPTNVGLLDVRSRWRRFSMHTGADVSEGFPTAEAQTKTKTNIFAFGWEDGKRVSVGASLKGRIWSYRIAESLKHWMDWCDYVGGKLIDEGLNIDEIMRNFIRPIEIKERPGLVPLAIEWPWETLSNTSDAVSVTFDGASFPLIDLGLELVDRSTEGPITFEVVSPSWRAGYRILFQPDGMTFEPVGAEARYVSRHRDIPLSALLLKNGVQIYFEHDSLVVHPGLLLRPERDLPPYDPADLTPLDWGGVDLRVESQGPGRRQDSIQARMVRRVFEEAEWDVVIDDDGSGEIADIVALKADGELIRVLLAHCKYVSGGQPRAQVGDLYEVCGQAQKSVRWSHDVERLIDRLARREHSRIRQGRPSGFMKGDGNALMALLDQSTRARASVTIALAQPGLSQSQASPGQLELLASTEVYLTETANATFKVYCSD